MPSVQGQGDTNTADFSTLETRQNDLQKVVGQLSVDGVQKLRENVTLIRKQVRKLLLNLDVKAKFARTHFNTTHS